MFMRRIIFILTIYFCFTLNNYAQSEPSFCGTGEVIDNVGQMMRTTWTLKILLVEF